MSGPGASGGPELVLINGHSQGHIEGHIGGQIEGNRADAAATAGGISALDRGLHFGDGVFETIACRGGRARFLSLHLERLATSCERLKIALGDVAAIRHEIQSAASGTDSSLIKLIVTRGVAVARGYGWSGGETATRVLLRYGWPQEDTTGGFTAAWRGGVVARVAVLRVGESPVLAGMKHLNRLEQVLARSEVPGTEAAELLLFSSSGRLVSGTMSNVFVVRNERIVTPRVDLCGVAGVMRRVVLREAAKAGLIAEEGTVSGQDLDAANEIFVTNARIGIWPVRMLGSRALAVGSVTRKLQALIAPMLENAVDA